MLTALERKLRRERIGTEVAGCLRGPDPVLSVRLFASLGTFPVVFQLPEDVARRIGGGYTEACVHALEAAHPLLVAQCLLVCLRYSSG